MIRTTLITFLTFVSLSASLHGGTPAEDLTKKADRWFSSEEGRHAMACILSWQSEHGDRPIFCDRDGVVKYDIEEIDSERRGGYSWYGNWGEGVAEAYDKWPYR